MDNTCTHPPPDVRDESRGALGATLLLEGGTAGFSACAWELRLLDLMVDCQCSSDTGSAWPACNCEMEAPNLRTSDTNTEPSARAS
eukprot:1153753-Pelagomonas_calceolata.AAC.2